MKSARFLLPLLFVIVSIAQADVPAGYYNTVDTTSQATLRATIHNIIDNHTRYPYTSSSTDTWDVLEYAEEYPVGSNSILDVYQNRVFTKFGGGTGEYNREHTWPKSYGFSSSGDEPYTDCHHLMLCDVSYNGYRSNDPFGDCTSGCSSYATDVNDGAGGAGQSNYSGSNGGVDVWETWDGRKGDVARAMFYMDVRYEGDVSGEPDLVLTDNASLIQVTDSSPAYMGLLSTLIEWHNADPVDEKERRRNDRVYAYQGNRNPFIDHPEYVGGVFLGQISAVEDPLPGSELSFNRILGVYPNPFNPSTRIHLSVERAGTVSVDIFALDGRKVRSLLKGQQEVGEISLSWNGRDDSGLPMPSGSYFCRLQSDERSDTRKMILLK